METTNETDRSPWLYFLAGALLPTIAFYLRAKPTNRQKNHGSDEYDSEDEDLTGVPTNGPSSSWGYRNAPYKMVFLVNQELGMGKGKIAAQCCHSAVGCYKRAKRQCPTALSAWERTGCAKIALKCPTESELERIRAVALSKDIPIYLVEDAGRTQIAAGSRTVLGMFGPTNVFEGVSDHLKLM